MAKKAAKPTKATTDAPAEPTAAAGITKITVRDFKSLAGEHSIEVRPLTILAGANSSGKSSIMQPLLLMKQTLEASYDPGALLLDGPNAKYTSSDQFFTSTSRVPSTHSFDVGLEFDDDLGFHSVFRKDKHNRKLAVASTTVHFDDSRIAITADLDYESAFIYMKASQFGEYEAVEDKWIKILQDRCFLNADMNLKFRGGKRGYAQELFSVREFSERVMETVHLPGLRGSPLRTYPVAAIGSTFPGTFQNYMASLIHSWSEFGPSEPLSGVIADIRLLGLASTVSTKQIDETQIEVRVSRGLPSARARSGDLVSIADVGFGVSQTLPVVVALHVAKPGQLVYIEQPEIHLHPRAQAAMAQVLANAAMRGVRVIVETHSDLLLLGIQTLVAEGKLAPDLVMLHWFERDKHGLTRITSAQLDERGAFGTWPEDFGDVQLKAQSRYLDAAELWSEAR